MEWMDVLKVVFRWLHVGTAIVVVGGSVFMRFILMPAAAQLPEAEHNALRERLMKRWMRWVHTGVLLFLVSGLYNYLVITRFLHRGDGLYHGLMGGKILLAFAVFFLAIALTGRSGSTEVFRRNAKKWMTVNIVLAALIVAISGFLKNRPATTAPVPPEGITAQTALNE